MVMLVNKGDILKSGNDLMVEVIEVLYPGVFKFSVYNGAWVGYYDGHTKERMITGDNWVAVDYNFVKVGEVNTDHLDDVAF